MWAPTYRYDYLCHHGILGMKWGKRNGPPYPLNKNDYSTAEKYYSSNTIEFTSSSPREIQKNGIPSAEEIKLEEKIIKKEDLGKERIINRLSQRTKFENINNDYLISEIILGKGATGIVREAQDKKDGKKYAIKTVWKADIEQNECFKKEMDR